MLFAAITFVLTEHTENEDSVLALITTLVPYNYAGKY